MMSIENKPSAFFLDDLDPRLTPARDDLAASWLKGKVKVPHYVDPKRASVTSAVATIYRAPGDATQSIETQLIYGEEVDVLDTKDGWSWIQNVRDGYVGYVDATCLGKASETAPTHRVSNIGAYVYATNNVKTTPKRLLSYGSLLNVIGEKEGTGKEPMFELANGEGFIPCAQLTTIDFQMDDPVAECFRFLGVPRLWGGRSHLGVDCSALIQLVFQACGITCPRDADLQERFLGKPVDRDDVQAGDLVFFRGHVGMMVDESTIIHVGDRSTAVSIDDLDEYARWRVKNGKTPVKMFKRL